MEVTFAHLADYASVSKEGKLSVMGIFENINVPEFPYTHPQMYLAFRIRLNYAEVGREIPLRIECVDADGNRVFQAMATFQLAAAEGRKPKRGDKPASNQVIGVNGTKFTRSGNHDVNIFMGDKLMAQIEFEVKRQPQKPDALA